MKLVPACVWLTGFLSVSVGKDLPDRVDNSRTDYFPPIVKQRFESCAQQVGIYYMLTYERCRALGIRAVLPENQLACGFAWHFLNRGINRGAELAEGWQLTQAMGVPSVVTYGSNEGDTVDHWISGYERYREAMRHGVRGYHFTKLTTIEDVLEAKRWLYERGKEEKAPGGLLAMEGRLEGSEIIVMPNHPTPMIKRWGAEGRGHVMTCVGYDDRVGMDFNGDGLVTNDRDLDGDGEVTLADWESGAFLLVNTYGTGWGHEGRVYLPYRNGAITTFRRGQWAARVNVRKDHEPLLTLKITLQSSDRSAIRLRVEAGEAWFTPVLFAEGKTLLKARQPDSPERYSRFVTGKGRLGTLALESPVEMGFDLSGALRWEAKTFALVAGVAPESGEMEAKIISASVRRYLPDGALVSEHVFPDLPKQLTVNEWRLSSKPPGQ